MPELVRPRIAIVSLGEAGNLGDDLILVAVVQAIGRSYPGAVISYLSFGQHLDWDELGHELELPSRPSRVTTGRDWPGSRARETLMADSDLIVFGGGGLLQTSHHPDRPYQWLSYLPSGKAGAGVIAAGLGLGPMSGTWIKRLREMGSPFDVLHVRDLESLSVASEMGWPAEVCRDFVDDAFLGQFRGGTPIQRDGIRLGVAVRAWPGLTALAVAEHVSEVARRHDARDVACFVLESRCGEGPDVEFAKKVSSLVAGVEWTSHVYTPSGLSSFVAEIRNCDVAISMKLHASAVWRESGVPIYPIVYAPKIASFFGLPYSGLEIVRRPVRPDSRDASWPRASEVVSAAVPRLLEKSGRGRGARIGRCDRLRYQVHAMTWSVVRRVRRGFARGSLAGDRGGSR